MIEELYRKTHNSAEAIVSSHICREDIKILPKFFKKLVVTGSKIRFRKEVIEFILERTSQLAQRRYCMPYRSNI